MLVQDFLRSGGTLADLESKYAVTNKRHSRFPNLILLKYSMIDSPMGDALIQECRGLILDQDDNWKVISHPFNKFFNHGEGHAKDIDWSTARVQEKYDGSLCTIYWYNDAWRVSTTGMPDASGMVNDFGISFADLFWKVWKQERYELPSNHNDFCFMFELMCPENRVVVRHNTQKLVLIGIRHLPTGQEYLPEHFAGMDWAYARDFSLKGFDDIIKTFDKIDPMCQEGYVVVDKDFNRVKVKHPGYVAVHHMRDNLTAKGILEVVRSGEYSEMTTYFPEWKHQFDNVADKLQAFKSEMFAEYTKIAGIGPQKDFASHAIKTRCPDFLFKYRSGKVGSVNEYFKNMRIEHLMSTLGLKNNEPATE